MRTRIKPDSIDYLIAAPAAITTMGIITGLHHKNPIYNLGIFEIGLLSSLAILQITAETSKNTRTKFSDMMRRIKEEEEVTYNGGSET